MFTSASIGITMAPQGGDGPEGLLRGADAAMYRAKAGGSGRYAVYDRGMHARAVHRLRMETELRRALDAGEITAHYQPIISLDTGRVGGVEALARWRHVERGWIPPQEFVALAEETGLIIDLGRRVLIEACRQLRAWDDVPEAAGLAVSVNLSVKQFAQADLTEQVRAALDDARMDPARLRLEVTESVLVSDLDAAAATLGRLRALGVPLWMDDFGTGYSSLSALHRLPMDGLKVDRSFVAAMGADGRAGQVLASIVGLARGLGMRCVAEGVERPEQAAELRALGCDAAQGYLFSRPLDGEAMRALLAAPPAW